MGAALRRRVLSWGALLSLLAGCQAISGVDDYVVRAGPTKPPSTTGGSGGSPHGGEGGEGGEAGGGLGGEAGQGGSSGQGEGGEAGSMQGGASGQTGGQGGKGGSSGNQGGSGGGPSEDTNELCSNKKDDDGDGYVDCADVDCGNTDAVTVCGHENTDALCSNNKDDDGDGFIDCGDFNCSKNPAVKVCGAGGAGGAGQGGSSAQAGQAGSGSAGGSGGAGSSGGAGGSGGAGAAGGSGASGSGGTCGKGQPGADCKSSCDCSPTQVCNSADQVLEKTICGAPQSSGAAIGAECGGDSECKSSFCDGYARTCSVFCAADADCGAGSRCIATDYGGGFVPDQCQRSCQRNDDCPDNTGGYKICMLQPDKVADTWVLGCNWLGPSIDAKLFGDLMVAGDTCETEMSVKASDGKVYCSRGCATGADCASPLPTCATLSIKNPSGTGTASFQGCTN